jgi:hypothetical protein
MTANMPCCGGLPLNELPPMHARGNWKPPIIVNINEITISPRKKGMNSSAGIVRVCARAIWIDVALRVTERSETLLRKRHHATRGAGNCKLKRAARQRSCMLLDDAFL